MTVNQKLRDHIEALLAEVYEPEGVQVWLDSRNRWLGMKRPVDLIEEGRGEDVLAAAERLVGGAW